MKLKKYSKKDFSVGNILRFTEKIVVIKDVYVYSENHWMESGTLCVDIYWGGTKWNKVDVFLNQLMVPSVIDKYIKL